MIEAGEFLIAYLSLTVEFVTLVLLAHRTTKHYTSSSRKIEGYPEHVEP